MYRLLHALKALLCCLFFSGPVAGVGLVRCLAVGSLLKGGQQDPFFEAVRCTHTGSAHERLVQEVSAVGFLGHSQ